MDGAHHGDVFEGHLGGPVLADGDAGVGAREPEIGAAYGRHPDKVVGPGEEGREGGGEGHVVSHAHAHRRGEHLLLGDEHLKVPLRVPFGEVGRVGGVADLAVEGDDVVPGGTHGLEGRPVGTPGRLFGAELPRR